MLNLSGQRRPIPLCSLARAANVSEQKVIKPLLNFAYRRLKWPMHFVVVDQGYVNQTLASFLRREWGVAQIVRPKTNMKPPVDCEPDGCPRCPSGERLVWEDYTVDDGRLVYRGQRQVCAICPLAGTCPKQFEFEAGLHETFWGMVPSHSRLAHAVLRKIRPRVEPGFNLTKNKYLMKDFFINSRHLAQTLCILSDILETLEILAVEQPKKGRETRKALIADLIQLEFWD